MRNFALLLSLGVLLIIGCNTSQEGVYDNIAFTPRDCGAWNTGCNFDDSVGVGGLVNVTISGIDNFPTAGVTLGSDDVSVLDVAPTSDIGGRPAWELFGVAEGVARLEAYDADDVLVDFIEVGVQALTGLVFDDWHGDAIATDPGDYDEAWIVQAGEDTSFYVIPTIGDEARTMGRYEYEAFLDAEMSSNLLMSADLGEGYLAFNVPEGDYEVSFETVSAGPISIDVFISAEAPSR
jgi:hypothetical protein